MRAPEAAELLRKLAENREGLTYSEPAGLRAAAEDALALIENRPSFKQAAAVLERPRNPAPVMSSRAATLEFPLDSPLRPKSRAPRQAWRV